MVRGDILFEKLQRLRVAIPALILTAALVNFGAQLAFGNFARNTVTEVSELTVSQNKAGSILETLIELQRGIELDVLHVQESLTDLSATRGMDGLDDGADLAAKSAEELRRKVADVAKLASDAKLPEVRSSVELLLPRFEAFYALGRKMTQAYVDGGPELGNKMMPEFDEASDALQKEMDASTKAISNLKAKRDAQLVENVQSMRDNEQSLLLMMALNSGFALFMSGLTIAFVLLWVVRPLGRITERTLRVADGQLDLDIPHVGRKDEIGELARSVEVFKQNGVERMELQAEADRARKIREEERLSREIVQLEEARNLKSVVDNLGAGLARLADFNVRMTIDEPFVAQFEVLRNDFNNSIAAFQTTLEQVMSSTTQVLASSQEMREAADNLSRRTEQQAASVEETSAALAQITATVSSSVENVIETRNLVREAKTCTDTSGQVVQNAVAAMKRIEGMSAEIGNIIDVIDQIAFQTNLLALNAGVEAARAGDAGKGFAVVAQEVRELAQRSAKAAKEISNLIDNSTRAVEEGVSMVEDTGHALEKISQFVAAIDERVETIATASREQSLGLNEIQAAIGSIDQMTQQNTSMVEESSSISATLAQSAEHLANLVHRFQINAGNTVQQDRRKRAA